MRGLKPYDDNTQLPGLCRTFTGAWIETHRQWCFRFWYWVAPLQVRGLKHKYDVNGNLNQRSRTFTGAWIETDCETYYQYHSKGRTFTGAWIETRPHPADCRTSGVAPLQVRGLKRIS